jgi:hypothetical protein
VTVTTPLSTAQFPQTFEPFTITTTMTSGACTYAGINPADVSGGLFFVAEFPYTGTIESIRLGTGKYKLEVWGANGGDGAAGVYEAGMGGAGGYSVGIIQLASEEVLEILTGGRGSDGEPYVSAGSCHGGAGGFGSGGGGGGGWCSTGNAGGAGGGGGMSLVRKQDGSTVLIIAGGGGGGGGSSHTSNGGTGPTGNCHGGGGAGGVGGGNSGLKGDPAMTGSCTTGGNPGSQVAGGINGQSSTESSENGGNGGAYYGGFGGGNPGTAAGSGNPMTFAGGVGQRGQSSSSAGGSGGGGGGYYGGGGGGQRSSGGGGGSGYIGGVTSDAESGVMAQTIPGDGAYPVNPDGTGYGYVRISLP